MTTDPRPDLTKDAALYEACRAFVAEQSEGEWGADLIARDAAKLVEFVGARIAQARAEEREACAGLADIGMVFPLRHGVPFDNERVVAKHIAAAIRALKETTND